MLSRIIENTSCYNLNRNILREVIVKIRLERLVAWIIFYSNYY